MEKIKYNWGSVPMGGGGFVTGIAIHPKDKNIKYIRTDVGGAYRFDAEKTEWIPLLEWVDKEEVCLYGVEAVAINPQNENEVYLACGNGRGKNSASRLLKSEDRGRTFRDMGLPVSFYGNGPLRRYGESLVIDPNDGNTIYVGTPWQGFFKSFDGGKTWIKAKDIPNGRENAGVRFVFVDPNGETENGRSKTVYAAPVDEGLFVSHDGGETFAHVDGSPSLIRRASARSDGKIIFAAENGLFLYDGKTFTEIGPLKGLPYSGVDINSLDNNRIICSVGENATMSSMNLPIYLSLDGGENWKYMNGIDTCRKHYSIPWWPGYYFASSTSCIKWDADSLTEVWFSDWYGVWVTKDITADVVDWYSYIKGHEEIVAFTMISPPAGDARLLTGVADNDGMRYEDIHEYPPARRGIATHGMDFCESDSNFIVAVGSIHNGAVGEAGYSTDNGITWTKMVGWDDNEIGLHIAQNPVDKNNMCALIINGSPRFTTDGGRYWRYSEGTPKDLITSYWGDPYGMILSDRVANGVYYCATKYGLYRSRDGGAHFSMINEDLRSGVYRAVPYREGEVWRGADEGLFVSRDFGEHFEKVGNFSGVISFDFGKGLRDGENTLYVYGILDGKRSKYRSDDYGKTFYDIGDEYPRGSGYILTADRKVYGRIYIATGGRGYYYAEPQEEK